MRRTVLLALTALTLAAVAPPAVHPDVFAPLGFLKGTWVGTGAGDPGAATGAFTFATELDGKVMLRRNEARFPAKDGRPASRHTDLMLIHPEGGALKAIYADNEGHVLHYTATPLPQGTGVAFLSDPAPGPRFRLTYRATTPTEVVTTFEIASPDQPEAFSKYLEGTSKRQD